MSAQAKNERFDPIPSLLSTKADLMKAQILSSCEEERARIQISIDGLENEIEKLRRR